MPAEAVGGPAQCPLRRGRVWVVGDIAVGLERPTTWQCPHCWGQFKALRAGPVPLVSSAVIGPFEVSGVHCQQCGHMWDHLGRGGWMFVGIKRGYENQLRVVVQHIRAHSQAAEGAR